MLNQEENKMKTETTTETKERVRIENWAIVNIPNSPYQAPELVKPQLTGDIFGHPKHIDGKKVTTSIVVSLDISNKICETENTSYVLGAPSAEFIEWLAENNKTLDDYRVY